MLILAAVILRFTLSLVLVVFLCFCGTKTAPDVSSTGVSPRVAPVSADALALVRVYTTAENTDKRLSLEGDLEFSAARQLMETEVAIFVNPEKKFQTYWA